MDSFCSNCGSAHVPGRAFCGECGAPVAGNSSPPPAGSRSKAAVIVGVVVAVLLLGGGGVLAGVLLAGGEPDRITGGAEDPVETKRDPSPTPTEPTPSEGTEALPSGSGNVTVASKDFTENILLGEMMSQALEEAGLTVNNQTNLGGTEVNRDALIKGRIDAYPDYNGTGWTVHLGRSDPSQDAEQLFADTAQADLAENGVQWVGRSLFNDTYGFALGEDLSQELGTVDLQGMADYLKANADATLCMESEFPARPDGLMLFEDATGYQVPKRQQRILDTGLIYDETATGGCDFGEVFTTDGRIPSLGLQVVEDPGAFVIYNASFTIRQEVYEANAAVYDAVADRLFADLDNQRMAELNAKVDVEGELPSIVAGDYLREIGILS